MATINEMKGQGKLIDYLKKIGHLSASDISLIETHAHEQAYKMGSVFINAGKNADKSADIDAIN